MKQIILGALAGILIIVTLVGGFVGYNALTRSNAYLFDLTDVKNDKGVQLNRAQIIDALINRELDRAKAAKAQAAPAPAAK